MIPSRLKIGIDVANQSPPVLGYTNRRNASPALERRHALVRRAARQYLLLIAAAIVVMSALALVATSFT
jgi:hypothetical protein